jgi:hypothetical protein
VGPYTVVRPKSTRDYLIVYSINAPQAAGSLSVFDGKPVMAWTPGPGDGGVSTAGSGSQPNTSHPTSTTPNSISTGRLYVLYLQSSATPPSDPPKTAVLMAFSNMSAGSLQIGLGAYYDNVWSFAYGLSLLTPSEAALRAAETYAFQHSQNHVFFNPHSDGMADLNYQNYDDWRTIGWGSCAVLVKTQDGTPIKCAPAW